MTDNIWKFVDDLNEEIFEVTEDTELGFTIGGNAYSYSISVNEVQVYSSEDHPLNDDEYDLPEDVQVKLIMLRNLQEEINNLISIKNFLEISLNESEK